MTSTELLAYTRLVSQLLTVFSAQGVNIRKVSDFIVGNGGKDLTEEQLAEVVADFGAAVDAIGVDGD